MEACPICNATNINRDPEGEFDRCCICGAVRTRFNYDASMYGQDYARNYLEYAAGPLNTPVNLFRLGLVSRWVRPKHAILDFGCCVGEFVRFAEKFYTCCGFEPNKRAAFHARHSCTSLVTSDLSRINLKFDAITLFDVVEHIEDPKGLLTMLRDKLNPKGVIAMVTPNVDAIPVWDLERLRRWKHYKPKEHLYLYNEASLTHLVEPLGFEVVHIGYEESDIRPGNPNNDIMTFVARFNAHS